MIFHLTLKITCFQRNWSFSNFYSNDSKIMDWKDRMDHCDNPCL